MLEEGISIIYSNMVVLCESNAIRQVLGKDEVTLSLSDSGPWDPSLATTLGNT